MTTILINNRDMSQYVTDFKSEISAERGGFYRADFELTGTREQLIGWQQTLLNAGVKAWADTAVFEGILAEMVLTLDGVPETLTLLDNFHNRAKAIYRSLNGNTEETPWFELPASQALFGVWEKVLTPSSVMVAENANLYVAMSLNEYAYPRSLPGEKRKNANDSLKLVAVGRCTRADKYYTYIPPAPDGVEPEDVEPVLVTDYVRTLIEENPWLRVGQIDTSTAEVTLVETNLGQRYIPVWTRLQRMAEFAATDGVPYIVVATEDGRVDFVRKQAAPIYQYANGEYTSGGSPVSAAARWGMARRQYASHTSTQIGTWTGTWYQFSSDFWVDGSKYSDSDGVSLVPQPNDQDALIAAITGDIT